MTGDEIIRRGILACLLRNHVCFRISFFPEDAFQYRVRINNSGGFANSGVVGKNEEASEEHAITEEGGVWNLDQDDVLHEETRTYDASNVTSTSL